MKKTLCFLLCLFLLLGSAVTVCAASDVPEEVLDATKSVVRIQAKYSDGTSTGSGFVIKNEPGEVLVVTNNHVIDGDPNRISIWVSEEETVDARIVVTTAQKDLCVLKVTDEVDMDALTLASKEPRQGSAIYAVGFPAVADIFSDTAAHTSESATITDGIISAIRTLTLEGAGDPVTLLQINADINSGNSGGPLFDAKGQVVGINTYGITNAQGVFGAISVMELKELLDENDISLTAGTSAGKKEQTNGGSKSAASKDAADGVVEPVSAGVIWGVSGGLILLILALALILTKVRKAKAKAAALTLRGYMQSHPSGVGLTEAVAMLLPVALRLQEMHLGGKLHLQVNPDNILVTEDGVTLKAPQNDQTACFCNGFTAPELYARTSVNMATDVYSFAAVLMYAVTGKVPGMPDQLQQDYALYELVSPESSQVVRSATAYFGQARISSMQDLIFRLSSFNTMLFQPPVPSKKRGGKGVWIGAAATCCVILAIALMVNPVFVPQANYRKANKMMKREEYAKAIAIFQEIPSYKDSSQCIQACELALKAQKYGEAKEWIEKGDYEKATKLLEDIRDYLDADALWKEYSGYYIIEKAQQNFEGKWIWKKPDTINPYDQYYDIDFATKTITFKFKSNTKEFERVYDFEIESADVLKATGFRDEGTVYIRTVGTQLFLDYPEGVHAPSKNPENLYLIRK